MSEESDLSGEIELLQAGMRRARAEIERLRRAMYGAELRWTSQGGKEPTKAHEGDAGFDLYVAPSRMRSGRWVVPAGEFMDIDCGISIELPAGVWAMITGRSSTLRKRKLLVAVGIIDQGYRGPLFAGVQNLTRNPIVVEPDERLAQLIPFPLVAATLDLVQVEELGDSDRGVRGFGSTGT
jgi:dUTP pyrophosphatase